MNERQQRERTSQPAEFLEKGTWDAKKRPRKALHVNWKSFINDLAERR